MRYEQQYQQYLQQAEQALLRCANLTLKGDSRVAQAARYSLFSGGKRVRAVLCLAVHDLLNGTCQQQAAELSAAIEMLHCYSLIHDDLPCMDDDDMRRGKRACHKEYDEATALLAGDALLTAAFEVCARAPLPQQQGAQAVRVLARAAGTHGMIYGQELDLQHETSPANEQQLRRIHCEKTGKLMAAAAELGAVAASAAAWQRMAVREYALGIGMVFQIVDDILDVVSSEAMLGKPIGSDAQQGKSTFVSLHGLRQAKELARQSNEQACAALAQFGSRAGFLKQLAQELSCRKK